MNSRSLMFLLFCVAVSGGSVGADDGLVSSWNFSGSLDDTAGQSREQFAARDGKARFVSADELPGVDGQAVAVGVQSGDAQYLNAPISADTRLGPTYTIEAWIHPVEVSGTWNRLLLNWTNERSYHFAIHASTVSLYHAQADRGERFCEGGRIEPHHWYCITAVASRDAGAPGKSTIGVYLNGKKVKEATFDGTIQATGNTGIGLGDSADGTGSNMRFRGYVDAVNIWNRALGPAEIAERSAARQEALDLPSREMALFREALARSPLDAAIALEQKAREFQLTDELAESAANLLGHEDVVVGALAEWAIAQKVGYGNTWATVKWTGDESVEWLRKWQAVPRDAFAEFDWVRHTYDRGVLLDADLLRQEIEALAVRAVKTAEASSPGVRAEIAAHLKSIDADLQSSRECDVLPELRRLWLSVRHDLRKIVFVRPELDFDRLIFYTRYAPHHKPNVCGVHYNWAYKPGGDIAFLDGIESNAEPTLLLANKLGPGHVHGMDLWFDANRVVFGWANQPEWPPRGSNGMLFDLCHHQNNFAFELMKVTEPVHLYEATLDGERVNQLTDDDYWSDLEPTYLPDGGIIFSSDRSGHSPSCDGWENDITDLNLYRLSADRTEIRRLANHKDIDMHPHLLDNGLIAYLRWEYQERDFWDTHSVWTMRPDGTMPDALFKQHMPFPTSVREARSVPDSTSLVAIAAGHHAYPVGPIVRLTPASGLNSPSAIDIVAMGSPPQERRMAGDFVAQGGVRDARGYYATPYALSEDCYLASFGFGSGKPLRGKSHRKTDLLSNDSAIYVLDTLGNKELIYRDRFHCAVNPLPLAKRRRPACAPDSVDPTKNYATCIVPDVYEGMAGVERGAIKYISIIEALPWPLTREGGSRYYGGSSFRWQVNQERNWNPIRVIGIVPVEEDGSAHFRVPTVDNASVAFHVLDEKLMSVQRMRSSVSFQPGEVRSCGGCHETRSMASGRSQVMAARRPPDVPRRPSWGHRPLGYEWMVQPVLTKHCARCHGGDEPEAGLDLSETKRTAFGHDSMLSSYFNILKKNLVVCTNQRLDGSPASPRQFGSHPSKLIRHLLVDKEHRALALTEDEWFRLVTWVDTNCPYHDQLYNKRPAGGGKPVREPFPWREPWPMPAETAAAKP